MNAPTSLYKFQTLNEYSLASLENSTIWLATPKSFNDPFDCAITLDRHKYKESVLHAITEAMEQAKPAGLRPVHLEKIWPGDKEAFESFRTSLLDLVQRLGICSFSAVPDHMLMWSHYANHHKGFCIEYDCREGTKLRTLAEKVKYVDEVPSLTSADFAPPDNEQSIDKLWLTKAKCWSYEQEWRVMANDGDKNYLAPSEIISIIFGTRMPQSDREKIRQSVKNQPDVIFREAKLMDGKFLLEIVDV